MNNIEISGYAVAPAEILNTKSGKEFAKLRIGVNSGKKPDGSYDSFFLNILCFGYSVPNVATIAKGDFVVATGQLKVEQYTTKEGNKGTSVTVLAREAYKAERHKAEQQSHTGNTGGFAQQTGFVQGGFNGGYGETNIPF